MRLYRVAVCAGPFGEGTCGAPGCQRWGRQAITFRDVAAFACSIDHVHDAAARLVMARIRRDVRCFRVRTYDSRLDPPEIGTSGIVRNEYCTPPHDPAVGDGGRSAAPTPAARRCAGRGP